MGRKISMVFYIGRERPLSGRGFLFSGRDVHSSLIKETIIGSDHSLENLENDARLIL